MKFYLLELIFSFLFLILPPPSTTYDDVALNAQAMVTGINLATFDITRAKPAGKQLEAIFKLTHTANAQQPDQMEPVVSDSRFGRDQKVTLIKTTSEFNRFINETQTLDVQVSGEFNQLGTFLADSFHKQAEAISKSHRYMAMSYYCQSTYKLTFNKTNLKLDPKLLQLIARGPGHEETIIRQYGTHYISSAVFGGCLLNTYEIDNHFFTEITQRWPQQTIPTMISMLFWEGLGFRPDEKLVEKLDKLQKTALHHCSSIGGTHSEVDCDDEYKPVVWSETVAASPRMVYVHLKPIYELDAFAPIRSSLEMAVQRELVKIALTKLKRHITINQWRFESYSSLNHLLAKPWVSAFLRQVDECLGRRKLSTDLEDCIVIAKQAVQLARLAEIQPIFARLVEKNRRKLRCVFEKSIYIEEYKRTFAGNVEFLLFLKKHFVKVCPQAKHLTRWMVPYINGWPKVKQQFQALWEAMDTFARQYPHSSFTYRDQQIEEILGYVEIPESIAYECSPYRYSAIERPGWPTPNGVPPRYCSYDFTAVSAYCQHWTEDCYGV